MNNQTVLKVPPYFHAQIKDMNGGELAKKNMKINCTFASGEGLLPDSTKDCVAVFNIKQSHLRVCISADFRSTKNEVGKVEVDNFCQEKDSQLTGLLD